MEFQPYPLDGGDPVLTERTGWRQANDDCRTAADSGAGHYREDI